MHPQALNVDPAQLRPNPWNSNHVSPSNEEKLTASIRRHGLFKPIVVRETESGLEILGGQHRWQIAVREGLADVPIVNLGRIDDKAAKEIGLLDNARYGADDALSLSAILAELGSAADLSTILPYSDTELSDILVLDNSSLDDLNIEQDEGSGSETNEPEADLPKAPKTHEIMRFKVPLSDAERIRLLVADVQKRQGFTLADEMTNAGDALVHLLLSNINQN